MLQMFSEGLKFIDKSVKKLLKPHAGWVLKVTACAKCRYDGLLLCLDICVLATFTSIGACVLLEASDLLCGLVKELFLLGHLTSCLPYT